MQLVCVTKTFSNTKKMEYPSSPGPLMRKAKHRSKEKKNDDQLGPELASMRALQAGSTVCTRRNYEKMPEIPFLSDEVATLAVVSALVLEPLSVSFHAANLLAVVVWDGVGDRVCGGINTVLADAVEEFLFFLQ